MQRQHQHRRQRGVSMAELLAALLILGIVITTTIAMFAERQARLRDASETILAWQALSNEAEIWRRIDFASLDSAPKTFRSDVAITQRLPDVSYDVAVTTPRTDTRQVTFTITWNRAQRAGSKRRSAELSILRVDTGGSGLW